MFHKLIFVFVLGVMMFAHAAVGAQAPADSAAALRHALQATKSGETIEISAGRYDLADLKIVRDTRLVGRGEVIFYSSSPTSKGLLNPLPGVSLHVENIAFHGAVSPDQNGAGIRHDGADLTVINCVFEDNENGILSTGDDNGRIRIQGSSFLRNGHGDGYSHGIYVVRAAELVISDSRFVGTKIGHHVKSLAEQTRITGSILDDADGRASYSVDASRGGDVLIANNRIIQSSDGDNSTIVNYDLSRGGDARGLVIVNNSILNRHPQGRLLRNATNLSATITGNEIVNDRGGKLVD
jgi:hypothetical protein